MLSSRKFRTQCGVGLVSSKTLIYQLDINSHSPDGASSYLWVQHTGGCVESITTARSTVDLLEFLQGGLLTSVPSQFLFLEDLCSVAKTA